MKNKKLLDRRGFLGTAVAAIAGAATLAGGKTAEAACADCERGRAEGYERAEFVKAKREESRASIGNAQGDTLMVVGSTTIVGNLNVVEPSYGGVYLSRHGQQVVCRTGEEVMEALKDDRVFYHNDTMIPDLHRRRSPHTT